MIVTKILDFVLHETSETIIVSHSEEMFLDVPTKVRLFHSNQRFQKIDLIIYFLSFNVRLLMSLDFFFFGKHTNFMRKENFWPAPQCSHGRPKCLIHRICPQQWNYDCTPIAWPHGKTFWNMSPRPPRPTISYQIRAPDCRSNSLRKRTQISGDGRKYMRRSSELEELMKNRLWLERNKMGGRVWARNSYPWRMCLGEKKSNRCSHSVLLFNVAQILFSSF